MNYIAPPNDLPGFPGTVRAKPKTPMRSGGLRKRWTDNNGAIYEWDYQHGHVEVYDARGRHEGAYDHVTGGLLSGPVSGRRVNP
jgi:hypothetical protein